MFSSLAYIIYIVFQAFFDILSTVSAGKCFATYGLNVCMKLAGVKPDRHRFHRASKHCGAGNGRNEDSFQGSQETFEGPGPKGKEETDDGGRK